MAGLMLGRMVPDFSAAARAALSGVAFWSLLDGLLNTMLFLLLGLQIVEVTYHRVALVPVLAAIPVALAARLISVAVPALCRSGSMREKMRGTRGADMGGLARRRLGRARADRAGLAVPRSAPRDMLRGRRVHDRRAGPDAAARRAAAHRRTRIL